MTASPDVEKAKVIEEMAQAMWQMEPSIIRWKRAHPNIRKEWSEMAEIAYTIAHRHFQPSAPSCASAMRELVEALEQSVELIEHCYREKTVTINPYVKPHLKRWNAAIAAGEAAIALEAGAGKEDNGWQTIHKKAFEAACQEHERKYRLTDESARFHDVGALRGYVLQVVKTYESGRQQSASAPAASKTGEGL